MLVAMPTGQSEHVDPAIGATVMPLHEIQDVWVTSLVVPAGDVVLKLNAPSHLEADHEADALAHWGGRGAVRLLAREISLGEGLRLVVCCAGAVVRSVDDCVRKGTCSPCPLRSR